MENDKVADGSSGEDDLTSTQEVWTESPGTLMILSLVIRVLEMMVESYGISSTKIAPKSEDLIRTSLHFFFFRAPILNFLLLS